ncbi:DUF2986 domain-containing protein [Umboniibacter marinipuniceus]|uniref:DUF2986 family protein n=1 Tax=Umboniibacter marinipuniceus TaxID=569599 RepID=A0A3M0AHY4_9GAMM|nr:DUF2986 domain-containing protein [Umboniibacter marinipuniceus]RMA82175.1 DUF2986 family protein [Umboniibacter marinipuniceus]
MVNRRKKAKQLFLAKKKKANAKLSPASKPKYVSKAERAKLAATTSEIEAAQTNTEQP